MQPALPVYACWCL